MWGGGNDTCRYGEEVHVEDSERRERKVWEKGE